MAAHPAPFPHGDLEEVFPDVFFLTGRVRFGPGMVGPRNMTVVRQGGDLVVLNSVRLDAAGEKKLEALGNVKHVVRLGHFHGLDDPYYVERFGAQLWAAPKIDVAGAKTIRQDDSPLEKATLFAFEKGKVGEIAVLLEREGGVLVTCDAYQNWTSTTFDECSLLCKVAVRVMGFGPKHIGGPWSKAMGPAVRADFDRLLELPFRHLLSGHGTLLRDDAKEGLREAIRKRYGA